MTQVKDDFKISSELMDRIVAELLQQRQNYTGSDAEYATIFGINKSVFSTLKAGKREGLISSGRWLHIAQILNVSVTEREWKFARTEVVDIIEEEVLFCKAYSKSMMFVDDCEIGKTTAARYLQRTVTNCFLVDCSQCKTAILFVRALARAIGVNDTGKIAKIKTEIKFRLRSLVKPVVILDEAGDLKHEAVMEVKEFWNATENCCGWYMVGAEGFREMMDRGRDRGKSGWAEMFSRMSGRYGYAVPHESKERVEFYRRLITDVLSVNMHDKSNLNYIVKRCLTVDPDTGQIGGLRRAESTLILNS